jgi:predicted RNA binding protein YcfA (HicA-like mRNA interferase family)
VAKARQVRRALEKAGWVQISMVGSHRKYRRQGAQAIFAFHDGEDLGGPAVARVAREFGMTVEGLRRLL